MFELEFTPSGPVKKCSKCGVVKAKDDFPYCSNSKDKVLSQCRACKVQHNTIYKRFRRIVNAEENRAERIAERAILAGRIQRKPCKVCGTTHKVEAHHDSYEYGRELDVIFLCHSCHRMRHKHLKMYKMNLSLL